MIVTDLAAVRARRRAAQDEAKRLGRAIAERIVADGLAAAKRAFDAGGSLTATDPDLSRAIYRHCRKRMRAGLRSYLGKEAEADIVSLVLGEADAVMQGRVWALQDAGLARDGRCSEQDPAAARSPCSMPRSDREDGSDE